MSSPTDTGKRRLGRGDWIEAALAAIERGGLAAVNVEGLGARLGVTKGSFYSHFRSRDELVEAALESWVLGRLETVRRMASIEEPGERLRQMLLEAVTFSQSGRNSVHMILLGELGDARVQAAVARVSETRLDLLTRSYRELGLPAQRARDRARLVYATYRGLLQMARESPDRRLATREIDHLLAEVNYALVDSAIPTPRRRDVHATDGDQHASRPRREKPGRGR